MTTYRRRQGRKSIHGSDLEDRSLGVGSPTSSNKSVGAQNARWAKVDLTISGVSPGSTVEYDVPHDLRSIPTVVELCRYENAKSPVTITARGVRDNNWSRSHVHVEVTLIAGSLDGCVAHFLVRGR
jgi:hypothetical protein